MQPIQLRFYDVFKHIENDCKFISGSKYPEYFDKKELIVPMLFTELSKLDHGRDYYIQRYIFEYQNCNSPSSITKFEIVNDYIKDSGLYTGYEITRKFNYLNINPVITNLNNNFTNVLKTTVIEMNVLSPVICGQFFENMVSLACNLDISQELNPSPTIEEKPDDIFSLLESLKADGEFKTIHHKNLAMCLLTQLVHATDLTNYFHEFILVRNLLNSQTYIDSLDTYLIELKKTLIGRLKKPVKSIKVYREPKQIIENIYDEYISGEADLITDDMVIDIKCYKNESIKLWKYQLEIYNNMIERPRKKLMIINLLSNKVYTWNITFDNVYEPPQIQNVKTEDSTELLIEE